MSRSVIVLLLSLVSFLGFSAAASAATQTWEVNINEACSVDPCTEYSQFIDDNGLLHLTDHGFILEQLGQRVFYEKLPNSNEYFATYELNNTIRTDRLTLEDDNGTPVLFGEWEVQGLATGFLAITPLTTTAKVLAIHTLSGTIYGGSTPLANATVSVRLMGDLNVISTVTTDASGSYSFSLNDNTYALDVVAPANSGFGSSVVNA